MDTRLQHINLNPLIRTINKLKILRIFFLYSIVISSCSQSNDVENKHNIVLPIQIPSASKDQIKSKKLISIQEVKAQIEQKERIVIFEISKREKFNEGSLPNAIRLWRPDYENNKDYPFEGMMASQLKMEALLSKNGVTSNSELILYDTKGNCDAMRFLWILNFYGWDKAKVMNGGKAAWEQAGYPLPCPKILKPVSTNFKFPNKQNATQFANFDMVKAAIKDSNVNFLDTREREEYFGEPYLHKGKLYAHKKGAYTHGMIPTAIHLNWADAVDLEGDHRIKSIKDLRYNFEQIGVQPEKEIITYCQSGVRSAHTAFILSEILGYQNVKNYDGSWIEWSYNYVKNSSVEIEQRTSKNTFDKMETVLREKNGEKMIQ